MLALRKYVYGPWERARGFLRLDLDDIETRVNQQWALIVDSNNKVKTQAISATTILSIVNANPPYSAGAAVALCRMMGGAW